MVNYGEGLIYKICCKDASITDEYIGSTCNKHRRKQQHKLYCDNENCVKYNYPVYQFIRNNGGFDNFDLIIIEEYPCENKNQLETRERYWIEERKPTLNKIIPTRNMREWRVANKDKIDEYNREYRPNYYEENREIVKEKSRKYKEENADKLKEVHTCECGGKYIFSGKSRHIKTLKHIKYFEELNL